MSIIKRNLMEEQNYSPYCGSVNCLTMPRTKFDGGQFVCPHCGWVSGFDNEFIAEYKAKWGIV